MVVEDVAETGLIARVRNLLLRPQDEWRRVAEEPGEGALGAHVFPLACGAAIAGFAATVLYGGFDLDADLIWAGVMAVASVVFSMIGVWLAGMAIDFLTKRFGGEPDQPRGAQLAAYAATPIFVAGLTALLPFITGLVVLAGIVYAFVLLGIGVPILLRLPAGRVTSFMGGFIALCGAAGLAFMLFINPLIGMGRSQVEALAQSMLPRASADAAEQAPASDVAQALARMAQIYALRTTIEPGRLEYLLPPSLPGGFTRTQVIANADASIARADGVYQREGARMNVIIAQFTAGGDHSSLTTLLETPQAGALAPRSDSVDGRLYVESAGAGGASYGVVGRGVVMSASGTGISPDDARAALETIDLQRVETVIGAR